jgi:hypothetical protein
MTEDDAPEAIITRSGVPPEEIACLLSKGKWKKAAHAS